MRGRGRRFLRGVLRWTLRGVAGIVVLVLVLVLVLLYSQAALRLAVDQGLAFYNGKIAGRIEIADVEGSLGTRFVLRGVRVSDRVARPLITADALTVDLSPWALVRGKLMVEELGLAGADVFLWSHADGSAFGDLAIPGPPKPPREGPGVGPDLPLDITVARLGLVDVDVFSGAGQPLVEALHVTAMAHAVGQTAEVDIHDARAELAGTRLTGLGLAARWTDPEVVATAHVATDLGRATLQHARFDVLALSGEIELAGLGDNAALSRRVEPWLARMFEAAPREPVLSVSARGSAADLSGEVRVALPGSLGAELTFAGSLDEGPRVFTTVTVLADLSAIVGADIGVVRPVVSGSLEGDADWQSLRAEVDVRCEACGALSGIGLWAAALQEGDDWDARLAAQAAGVSLTSTATIAAGELRAGEVDLTIAELATPLVVAEKFAAVPAMSGSLAVGGRCGGDPLWCTADVDLRRFRGFAAELQRLGVAVQGAPFGPVLAADGFVELEELRIKGQRIAGAEAFVTLGPKGMGEGGAFGHQLAREVAKAAGEVAEDDTTVTEQVASEVAHGASGTAREGGAGLPPLEIGIEAEAWAKQRDRGDRARVVARVRPGPPLEVDVEGLSVHLRGLLALLMRPTHVRVEGERVAVRGFDLKAAGGRITADGVFDRGGRSDLDVDVDGVSLDTVAKAVPQLRRRIGGTVGVHVHLDGAAHDPTFYLRADARKLWFQATQIGDVDVGVDLVDRDLKARLTVVGPFADRVAVMADTRVRADLKRMKFELLPAPLRADVDVERAHLSELRPWLSGMEPQGEATVHAVVRGTTSSPVVAVRISGEKLGLAKWVTEGGAVVADAAYDNGHVHGMVEVQHLEGRAKLLVESLPLAVDLVAKTARWRPEAPTIASLVVRDFDLWRQLSPIKPGQNLAGKVGLDLKVSGTGLAPEIAATITGERLRVRDADLGSVKLTAGYAGERATVDARVHGGLPGEVTVHAAAPVRLAPAVGEVTWLKDQPHEVAVKVAAFDLAGLRKAGLDAPVRGTLGVTVAASGTPADPKIAVTTNVQGFHWRMHRVGTVGVTAKYADARVHATVKGQVGDRGKIDARAGLPLAIDLAGKSVKWDRHAQHDVHVGVTGIDRSMLVPLGAPIPMDALIGLSLEANAKGGLDTFVADVELHGQIGHTVFGGAPVHLSAHAEPKSQRASFVLGSHIISESFGIKATAKADIPGLIAGTAKAADTPITASASSTGVDLRFLKAFTPPGLYDPIGKLSLGASVTGTVGRPNVKGRLRLRDGGITVLALQQRLRDIDIDVHGEGRHVELEQLVVRSGPGKLTTRATVDISKDGTVKLASEVVLDKFPLVRPGLPQMQIASKIKAGVTSGPKGTDVDVSLAGTKVLVTGYTVRAPKAIPDNENVRGLAGEHVRPIDVKEVAKEQEPPSERSNLRLNLKLKDPIRLTGPATEMEWGGALVIIKEGDKPVVTGALRAEEGRFDLLGNRFKIETGEVTLPEGELTIDPFLSVVATTSTPQAQVKVTVRGRVSRPQLIFSAEPPMPQPQILTLLLTGSTDANEADTQKVLAEAATLLVIAENPALANFVNKATGLDYVGVSFGETTNQPILTVGKHIDKRIYAETAYKHNAPIRQNRVEARIEYELAPRWTLETFFGDAAVGGVDVFWRKVFGKPTALKSKPAKVGTEARVEPTATPATASTGP
jgi:autotransporter translocation and assembly factor TamB